MSGHVEQLASDLSMTLLAFLTSVAAVIALALRWGRSWRDQHDDGDTPPGADQHGDQGPTAHPRPPHR